MEYNSSEASVAWFRDQYREGSLVIKPPFQRKPVWTARQKCYLVESVLLRLPVPEVFVQQSVTPEGDVTYAVVDGQQRIRTVLQFVGSETDPEEEEFNKFALDKLPTDSAWSNLTFADLSDDAKKAFYGYNFGIRYLSTDSDDEVRDMFRRLNKYLTPLSAQELRNATYSGPLVRLASTLSDNDYWIEAGIVTPAVIRRMNDIEFVSELIIGTLHGPQGGSATAVDRYYEQYEDFETEFPEQRRARRLFQETLATIQKIVPRIRDVRWSNRTDFYTLFVAMAFFLRSHSLPARARRPLAAALSDFADEVDTRLSNDRAKVSDTAVSYVRAVGRGSSEKSRRAARHQAIIDVMRGHFKARPGA